MTRGFYTLLILPNIPIIWRATCSQLRLHIKFAVRGAHRRFGLREFPPYFFLDFLYYSMQINGILRS